MTSEIRNKREPVPVPMHSFEEVYANKSRHEVMTGKKPYSNLNPVDISKIRKDDNNEERT